MSVTETRLGTMEAGPDSDLIQAIKANQDSLRHSLKLMFSLPLYKYIQTPTARKLEEAEKTFDRYNVKKIISKDALQGQNTINFITFLHG